jgi:hypothetical protein
MNAIDIKAGAHDAQPAGSEHDDSGSSPPQKLGAAAITAKFVELKSSPKSLTSEEAKARLAKDGPTPSSPRKSRCGTSSSATSGGRSPG